MSAKGGRAGSTRRPASGRARPRPEPATTVLLERAVRGLAEGSWGEARRLIASGRVTLDGEVETDCRAVVPEGARVEVHAEPRRPRREPGLDPSWIVHLDRHVVVLVKPPGISTVPFEEGEKGTVLDLLRRFLVRQDPAGPRSGAGASLWVVHRLDRGTSGLLAFARTHGAAARLKDQLRERSVHRRYLALVHGRVADRTLESHLVLDRGDGRRGSVERSRSARVRRAGGGKRAVTHVEALEELEGATLVACRLETGRTNQVRIHLSEAGHPLLGETIYMRGYLGPVLEAPRLMLHAAELGFVHPATGLAMRFERPAPEDMAALTARLRRRPPARDRRP